MECAVIEADRDDKFWSMRVSGIKMALFAPVLDLNFAL